MQYQKAAGFLFYCARTPILCRSKIGFWPDTCLLRRSGGSQVLVDKAVQDRFSADPPEVEVCCEAMESVRVPSQGHGKVVN
jgi:hypothetical protein